MDIDCALGEMGRVSMKGKLFGGVAAVAVDWG